MLNKFEVGKPAYLVRSWTRFNPIDIPEVAVLKVTAKTVKYRWGGHNFTYTEGSSIFILFPTHAEAVQHVINNIEVEIESLDERKALLAGRLVEGAKLLHKEESRGE